MGRRRLAALVVFAVAGVGDGFSVRDSLLRLRATLGATTEKVYEPTFVARPPPRPSAPSTGRPSPSSSRWPSTRRRRPRRFGEAPVAIEGAGRRGFRRVRGAARGVLLRGREPPPGVPGRDGPPRAQAAAGAPRRRGARGSSRVVGALNGEAVAYVDVDCRPKRDPGPGESHPRPYISDLAVRPDHRRRNLAARASSRRCEAAVLDWGYDVVYLKVEASNTAARRMYANLGYDLIHTDDSAEAGRRRPLAPPAPVTGFKWFNGQGLIYPYEDNARARRYRAQSDVFRGWLAANSARLLSVWKSNIQPDFNGLGKYVSGIMKRDKSLATHCAAGNATCVAELNAKRITVDVDDLLKRSVTAEAKHWAEMRARAAARGIIVILRRETTRASRCAIARPASVAFGRDAGVRPRRRGNRAAWPSLRIPRRRRRAASTTGRRSASRGSSTPAASFYGVALTRDGTRAAAGIGCGDDNACKVWDVTTGALVHTLAGHDRDVTGCAFSGDGSVIVTSSGDKTARAWDAGDRAPSGRSSRATRTGSRPAP
ncbi:hypothetical protein SO694_00207013 [Aureococcus anophagefferens]|uniref:N-acetyltransferase domain-containing protein n=1 Tax=Aureococcus anophagefferens TaxID=44056 RepID=A0ABR1FNL9_AURAN